MTLPDSLQKLSQANPNCEFLNQLIQNYSIFDEIYSACGNRFWKGCGSYLFDGQTQEQCDRMYLKQKALFEQAKKATHVLEIGVQMAHSMQIMLLANPTLEITAIDIDDTYSKPAIEVIRTHFPEARIQFQKSDSRNILPSIKGTYNLFHIDGDHRADVIAWEQKYCINMVKGSSVTFVFDDYSAYPMMVQRLIADTTHQKVKESILPNCDWTNAIFVMERE